MARGVLLALIALFLVPLWLPTFLPFVDMPCRADELHILARLGDPEFGFDRWYEVDRWLHPKMAYRMLLLPIAKAFSGDVAERLWYSVYLVGAPLAVMFALRQGGRSLWPALLVFPGLYSFPIGYGFGTYSVGTAALVFAFGCWERWREGVTLRAFLGLCGLSALVFLVHPQAFLYWIVTASAMGLVGLLSGRWTWRDFGALLGSYGTGAALFYGYASVSFDYSRDPTRSDVFVWMPGPLHRLKELPDHLGAYWEEGAANPLLAATVLLIAVLWWPLLSMRDGDWKDRLWRARWWVAVTAFFGGAMAIPESFGRQHFIASRFPSMGMLVLPLALAASPLWEKERVRMAAVGLAALTGVVMIGRMTLFDAEAAGMTRVIEALPDDPTTQCNIDLRWSMVNDLPAYDCACAWIHMEADGLNGYLPHRTGLDHLPAYDIPGREYGSWRDDNSAGFHYGTWGNQYEYWVVRDEVGETTLDGGPIGGFFSKVHDDGPWRVYRRTKDFPPGFNVSGTE